MHKLTNTEAQRVMSVLEETVDRVSFMALVPTKADAELLDELAKLGDAQLTAMLEQQWELEENYERICLGQRPGAVTLGESSAEEETKQELCASTRALCRLLGKNDAAIDVLRRQAASTTLPTPTMAEFERNLRELKAITFRKLSTTVEEDAANKRLLQELTEKERQAAEEATALQQTLETQRAEREREISAQEETLAKLRAELDEVTTKSEAKMEACRTQADADLAKAAAQHQENMARAAETNAKLQAELDETSQANRESEAVLRKKKERAEADLKALIDKYHHDIDDVKRQTEELKAKMAEEAEELRILEEHFAKVDANEARKNDEEALLDAFAARCRRADAILGDAATTIQKVVRGRQLRGYIRQLMAKKGKKGAKGKAKGKAKKKKK